MSVFSKNLLRLRKQKRISQEKLSIMSGLAQSAISMIESDQRSPSEQTMNLIADALGIPLSVLLTDPDAPPASVVYDTPLTETERQLISDYRTLNSQGREIILQQMDMVKKIYGGSDTGLSDLEERYVMGE